MKPSQLYFRAKKLLGMRCSIGCSAADAFSLSVLRSIATVEELDTDPDFLARFCADELMQDEVMFLNRARKMDWQGRWHFSDETPLWNYNLHYFEYLLALLAAYRKTGEVAYIEKAVACVAGWIDRNPLKHGGTGWEPYTVSLRLTSWLSFYVQAKEWFSQNSAFSKRLFRSIHEQYRFLAQHTEKDLLGNHYFENIKTLVLCALFFQDESMLRVALKELKMQCKEQILPDGMHFELSPMYHHIILEGMLRVAVALRSAECRDSEIESYLQPMLDAAHSLSEGLERLPLFNDCGNNVAKSLNALQAAAKIHFGLTPRFQNRLEASGYYVFKQGDIKLIVDAGQPGPQYIPGHAHCDAMSFELFKTGKPVLVNCGTYAYQCQQRGFFRSTAAHNTVMQDGVEQSECWGNFRLARRARVEVCEVGASSIVILMNDWKGIVIRREIHLVDEGMEIIDRGQCVLTSWLHIADDRRVRWNSGTEFRQTTMPYAPEFGTKDEIRALVFCAEREIRVQIAFLKG